MKIEKVNDNQIRCILNQQDLNERELRLSELAYGSDKAKALFRDMMQEAFQEYGFEAEDLPLMIEAIPTSPESIILVITKVENPEELDTRFSNFTPYGGSDSEEDDSDDEDSNTASPFANTMLDQLSQITDTLLEHLSNSEKTDNRKTSITKTSDPVKEAIRNHDVAIASTRVFYFRQFTDLTGFAKNIYRSYRGNCTLYKNPADKSYYLCMTPVNCTAAQYNKACNIACEYGTMLDRTTLSYYKEHYSKLLEGEVLAKLAKLA